MKNFLSIFLLVIISIKCLPLKELGKCLFESSFVEEDVYNKSIEKKEGKDCTKEFFTINNEAQILASIAKYYSTENIALYTNPFADLSIQPPNA